MMRTKECPHCYHERTVPMSYSDGMLDFEREDDIHCPECGKTELEQ